MKTAHHHSARIEGVVGNRRPVRIRAVVLFFAVFASLRFMGPALAESQNLTPIEHLHLVLAQIADRQYDKAVKTCEEFLQKFPGHEQRPEILCQLADAHLKQEHVAECEKYATQVIDDYPAAGQARKAWWLLTGAKMVKQDWPGVAKTLQDADFKLEDITGLWSQLKYATPHFNKRVDLLSHLLTTLERDLNIDLAGASTASPQAPTFQSGQARYMLADLYTFAGRNQPALDLLLPLTTETWSDNPTTHNRQLGNIYYLLGQNHAAVGDFRQGAEWYEKLANLDTDGTSRAGGLIESARLYMRLGDEKKANELYEQVAQYGNGWMTGMAISEKASFLIDRGDYTSAKALLSSPVLGAGADQVRIVMLSRLGLTSFLAGQWKDAAIASRECLRAYTELREHWPGEGIEEQVALSHARLFWVGFFSDCPIYTSTDSIAFSPSQPVRSLVVRTYQSSQLTLSTNTPLFHAELVEMKNRGIYWEHELCIALASSPTEADLDGMLTIRSESIPRASATIRLHYERPLSVFFCRPKVIWWGFVSAGERHQRAIEVLGSEPFQIVEIKTNHPAIDAMVDISPPKERNSHIITATLTTRQGERNSIVGQIQVLTDNRDGSNLSIPFYAIVS